jgi:DNA-binding transcriptional MerR regulator
MTEQSLHIGEVAVRAGVSVDTVRFYERERLLPSAGRTLGGFRLFPPEAVNRIRFIKQAQELGFALDEIRDMLRSDGSAECRYVHDLLKAKLAEVDERLERMRAFHRQLATYLAECGHTLEAQGEGADCPVVEEIAHRPLVAIQKQKEKRR